MNIDAMLEDMIEREGGYVNHPNDRGGPTKYGITEATLDRFQTENHDMLFNSVKDITRSYAKAIYRQDYYLKPRLNELADDGLRALMFDSCVLHGRGTAIRWLQKACGAKMDGRIGPKTLQSIEDFRETVYPNVLAQRIKFITNIVIRDKSQLKFLSGWMNRVLTFL